MASDKSTQSISIDDPYSCGLPDGFTIGRDRIVAAAKALGADADYLQSVTITVDSVTMVAFKEWDGERVLDDVSGIHHAIVKTFSVVDKGANK